MSHATSNDQSPHRLLCLCLRTLGISGKHEGSRKIKRPIKCLTNPQQQCLNLPDCTSFSLCFFFIRCEVSMPVTDSRGFSPKPGAEVLQPCDGEMRLRNRGSCKSVRQDPRCVQLCPVKTLLPV